MWYYVSISIETWVTLWKFFGILLVRPTIMGDVPLSGRAVPWWNHTFACEIRTSFAAVQEPTLFEIHIRPAGLSSRIKPSCDKGPWCRQVDIVIVFGKRCAVVWSPVPCLRFSAYIAPQTFRHWDTPANSTRIPVAFVFGTRSTPLYSFPHILANPVYVLAIILVCGDVVHNCRYNNY